MRDFASTINVIWAVIGDFNRIVAVEGNMGGSPNKLNKNIRFMECHNDCGLKDSGYTG